MKVNWDRRMAIDVIRNTPVYSEIAVLFCLRYFVMSLMYLATIARAGDTMIASSFQRMVNACYSMSHPARSSTSFDNRQIQLQIPLHSSSIVRLNWPDL